MVAEYFYNRLKGYSEDSKRTGNYRSEYIAGQVSIHRKGDDSEYFVIFLNKSVLKRYVNDSSESEIVELSDLSGDDFEPYNITRIIKSGYLCLNISDEQKIKEVISELYNYIESCAYSSQDYKPCICGAVMWGDDLTDRFQYYSCNKIYTEVHSIECLNKRNIEREYYNLRVVPFISDEKVNSKTSIHVDFVESLVYAKFEKAYKECEVALSELLAYMDAINIDYEWVECEHSEPVYF